MYMYILKIVYYNIAFNILVTGVVWQNKKLLCKKEQKLNDCIISSSFFTSGFLYFNPIFQCFFRVTDLVQVVLFIALKMPDCTKFNCTCMSDHNKN